MAGLFGAGCLTPETGAVELAPARVAPPHDGPLARALGEAIAEPPEDLCVGDVCYVPRGLACGPEQCELRVWRGDERTPIDIPVSRPEGRWLEVTPRSDFSAAFFSAVRASRSSGPHRDDEAPVAAGGEAGLQLDPALERTLAGYYDELCPDTLCESGVAYDFERIECRSGLCTVTFVTAPAGRKHTTTFSWRGPVLEAVGTTCAGRQVFVDAVLDFHRTEVGDSAGAPPDVRAAYQRARTVLRDGPCGRDRARSMLTELCEGAALWDACGLVLSSYARDAGWVSGLRRRAAAACTEGEDLAACRFARARMRAGDFEWDHDLYQGLLEPLRRRCFDAGEPAACAQLGAAERSEDPLGRAYEMGCALGDRSACAAALTSCSVRPVFRLELRPAYHRDVVVSLFPGDDGGSLCVAWAATRKPPGDVVGDLGGGLVCSAVEARPASATAKRLDALVSRPRRGGRRGKGGVIVVGRWCSASKPTRFEAWSPEASDPRFDYAMVLSKLVLETFDAGEALAAIENAIVDLEDRPDRGVRLVGEAPLTLRMYGGFAPFRARRLRDVLEARIAGAPVLVDARNLGGVYGQRHPAFVWLDDPERGATRWVATGSARGFLLEAGVAAERVLPTLDEARAALAAEEDGT